MTKKEKLYKEYLELRNEYYTLKGETNKVIELNDEYLNSYNFSRKVQAEKTSELEHDIACMKSSIIAVKKELERQAYFNTPEGNKYRTELVTERNAVRDKLDTFEKETRDVIKSLIEGSLGSGWEVGHLGRYMRICYIKGYNEAGEPLLTHTYDFSIDYERKGEKDVFGMNYPTHGTWDLLNDEDMRAYVAGIGKFAVDKELHGKLLEVIKEFNTKENELFSLLYKIDDKINNPEALRDK